MKQLVRVLQDFPEMKLVGRELGPFTEGEEVSVEPWEALVLEEREIIEPMENFSLVGLRKQLMKEEKSSRLEDLPPNFYFIISLEIEKLRQKRKIEKAEEMKDVVKSLLSLRVQKIVKMAISSTTAEGLPPEEIFLLNRLSQTLESWRRRLDRLFEKPHSEEVGAHKRGIRRSIQRIVGNTESIQE